VQKTGHKKKPPLKNDLNFMNKEIIKMYLVKIIIVLVCIAPSIFSAKHGDSLLYKVSGVNLILNQKISSELKKYIKEVNISNVVPFDIIVLNDSVFCDTICFNLEKSKLTSIDVKRTIIQPRKPMDSLFEVYKINFRKFCKDFKTDSGDSVLNLTDSQLEIKDLFFEFSRFKPQDSLKHSDVFRFLIINKYAINMLNDFLKSQKH
jgi:hypothetical protein